MNDMMTDPRSAAFASWKPNDEQAARLRAFLASRGGAAPQSPSLSDLIRSGAPAPQPQQPAPAIAPMIGNEAQRLYNSPAARQQGVDALKFLFRNAGQPWQQ
jgi:hypothetical protein